MITDRPSTLPPTTPKYVQQSSTNYVHFVATCSSEGRWNDLKLCNAPVLGPSFSLGINCPNYTLWWFFFSADVCRNNLRNNDNFIAVHTHVMITEHRSNLAALLRTIVGFSQWLKSSKNILMLYHVSKCLLLTWAR